MILVNRDIEELRQWTQFFLLVASICTTAFPIIWAFSRWWTTLVGRLLMFQAVAFSFAIDMTLFFQYWEPGQDDIMKLFWLNAFVFGLIAISTMLLTVTMVRMNYLRRKRKKRENQNV